MIYSLLILLFSAISTAAKQNCSAPVSVVLWDQFGDSWNGAEWFVEAPDQSMSHFAPDCESNPRIIRKDETSSTSGLYYMTVNTPDNSIPQEWWEIFWTVHIHSTGEYFTGGFNTTMVFDFNLDECKWSLVHYLNLWNNTKDCDGCGNSQSCPPPKPKPSPKSDDGKNDKPKPGKGDESKPGKGESKPGKGDDPKPGKGDESIPETEEQHDEEEQSDDKKKSAYGPPAVDVSVVMYDEDDNGWWQNNYLGTSWYIYDANRTELFESGTLCSGSYGKCDLCLGDGSYIYRATYNKFLNLSAPGQNDNHADAIAHDDWRAWQFCGVSGHYSDELHFHIKKGKCYADYTRCLVDINAARCSASAAASKPPSEVTDLQKQIELKQSDSINGSSYDFASIAYIMAAIGVGLIAVATMFSRRMSSYSKLQEESSHSLEFSEVRRPLESEEDLSRPSVRSSDRSKLML